MERLRSASRRGCADGVGEAAEPRVEIACDVDANDAPAMVAQRLQVPRCLSALEDREGELLAGNRHVRAVVGGDLDVHAGVRAALVELPGAVQEARPEA